MPLFEYQAAPDQAGRFTISCLNTEWYLNLGGYLRDSWECDAGFTRGTCWVVGVEAKDVKIMGEALRFCEEFYLYSNFHADFWDNPQIIIGVDHIMRRFGPVYAEPLYLPCRESLVTWRYRMSRQEARIRRSHQLECCHDNPQSTIRRRLPERAPTPSAREFQNACLFVGELCSPHDQLFGVWAGG